MKLQQRLQQIADQAPGHSAAWPLGDQGRKAQLHAALGELDRTAQELGHRWRVAAAEAVARGEPPPPAPTDEDLLAALRAGWADVVVREVR